MWFFRISYSYMIHDALGDPPRLTHQKILENKQVKVDHASDVFPICRLIMEIGQAGIDRGVFMDGYEVMDVLDSIIAKAREALSTGVCVGTWGPSPSYAVVYSIITMDLLSVAFYFDLF